MNYVITPPNCVAVAGFWRRYGGGCFTPLDVCCGFWWRLKEEDALLR